MMGTTQKQILFFSVFTNITVRIHMEIHKVISKIVKKENAQTCADYSDMSECCIRVRSPVLVDLCVEIF